MGRVIRAQRKGASLIFKVSNRHRAPGSVLQILLALGAALWINLGFANVAGFVESHPSP